MRKLRLLVVANRCPWASWPEKLADLYGWFSSKIELEIALKHTEFYPLPFAPYTAEQGGSGFYGIETAWYDATIGPLGRGYDIVLFVVEWDDWRQPNNAWGYRTGRTGGAVGLQIAADENRTVYVPNVTGKTDAYGNNLSDQFFEQARHELLHALFFVTGQPDTTHKWLADHNQADRALDELALTDASPSDIVSKIFAWLAQMASWIKTGSPGPMPPIPPEALPEPPLPSMDQPKVGQPPSQPPVPITPKPPSMTDFSTPKAAYHSVRVICDEMGLPITRSVKIGGQAFYPKDIICACIFQESRFSNKAVGKNAESTDWGLVQVNDTPGWHIGPGLQFPSVEYVVDHPEEPVRWMVSVYKQTGKLQPWASYTTGAYKQWLSPSSPMWKLAQP